MSQLSYLVLFKFYSEKTCPASVSVLLEVQN